jgi:hypothetical protein
MFRGDGTGSVSFSYARFISHSVGPRSPFSADSCLAADRIHDGRLKGLTGKASFCIASRCAARSGTRGN